MITAPIALTAPCLGGLKPAAKFVAGVRSAKPPTTLSSKSNPLRNAAPKTLSTRRSTRVNAVQASAATKLAIGDNVSAVTATLLTNDNKQVNLSQLAQDTGIIIFAYPKAATSGCTKQACAFRDNYDDLRSAGFEVYGISFDAPEDQTEWKNDQNLQYSLLTDTDGAVLKAFGAFKEPRNVVRSHFVIAEGGKILEIANGVSSGDSFGQVSDFVTNLNK